MTATISRIQARLAACIVRDGGVIAYPTEGVFGLGCDPLQQEAVLRIMALKNRPLAAGLILIAADREQLHGWIDPSAAEERALTEGDSFTTWVVTKGPLCPEWISGQHPTLAVRITRHPIAAALCAAADMPLVSTSANRRGQPAARNGLDVRRIFGPAVDLVVSGTTGGAAGPSEIRIAESGTVLRAG